MADPEAPMGVVVFYGVLALAFVAMFARTCLKHPKYETGNVDWGAAWFWLFIVDYVLGASAVCGVILSSESWAAGGAWAFANFVLGAPFGCLFLIVRLAQQGSLALLDAGAPPVASSDGAVLAAQVFFALLGIAFQGRFIWTAIKFPLAPPKLDDWDWLREWTLTTLGDLYTQCFVMCGIVLFTEPVVGAIVWCLVICLTSGLGSCGYLLYRLITAGSIALAVTSADVALVNVN